MRPFPTWTLAMIGAVTTLSMTVATGCSGKARASRQFANADYSDPAHADASESDIRLFGDGDPKEEFQFAGADEPAATIANERFAGDPSDRSPGINASHDPSESPRGMHQPDRHTVHASESTP